MKSPSKSHPTPFSVRHASPVILDLALILGQATTPCVRRPVPIPDFARQQGPEQGRVIEQVTPLQAWICCVPARDLVDAREAQFSSMGTSPSLSLPQENARAKAQGELPHDKGW
jgi:hypothetical protein